MAKASARTGDNALLKGSVVIFDLDGTLVDTAPDLVRALNATMASRGFPPTSLDDVRAMVGRGSRALILRALASQGAGLPEPEVEALRLQFLEHYAAGVADESVVFPGARDVLGALASAGAHLCVATNKPDVLADAVLQAFELAAWFDTVIGADRAPRKKPDAAHLVAAAGRHGLTRAVMVGDSGTDVAAARQAGAPVLIMRHGYSETPVETLGADAVLDGFGDLIAALTHWTPPAKPGSKRAQSA